MIEGLPEDGWTDIGMGEDATLVRYRPAGWEEQSYVVTIRNIGGTATYLYHAAVQLE